MSGRRLLQQGYRNRQTCCNGPVATGYVHQTVQRYTLLDGLRVDTPVQERLRRVPETRTGQRRGGEEPGGCGRERVCRGRQVRVVPCFRDSGQGSQLSRRVT